MTNRYSDWFPRVLGLFSVVATSLLLLSLMNKGLGQEPKLHSLVVSAVAGIDNFVNVLATALTPQLVDIVTWLNAKFGTAVQVRPDWRWYFSFVTLYLFIDAVGYLHRRARIGFAVAIIAALTLAFFFSILATSLRVPATTYSEFASAALMTVCVFFYIVIGTLVHAFLYRDDFANYTGQPVESFGRYCRVRLTRALLILLVGLLVQGITLLPPAAHVFSHIHATKSPGLYTVAACMLLLGVYWAIRGAVNARRVHVNRKIPLWTAFISDGNTKTASRILGAFFLAAAAIAQGLFWEGN